MGRASCSPNVSACDSTIGCTDTTTNTFRVHCFFFQSRRVDTTSPIATAANGPTVYISLFLMSSFGRALPIDNYWIKFDRGGLCYYICFHPVPASSPFTGPSTM
mmetsp:Transcript_39585/g.45229  ORF Transcript_39585/g.45229 Transcript_39585/m.45229 type:complete len:104 (+) Transcript_39585:438-749(+)